MDSFATGRGIRAADLNRLASGAASKGLAGSAYLAHSNGFELVQRNPRRQRGRGRGGDGQTDIAVITDVNAGTAGPRTARVYDPATMATRTETVCPAEIAGQFAAGSHSAAHVVAIRCALATAGDEED